MASHLTGCLHYPASIILVSLAPNRKPIIRHGTQAVLKYLITLMARRVVTSQLEPGLYYCPWVMLHD